MNIHPVVASLPEHEHGLIFERFKEIYLESQTLEMNLFGRMQVDCAAFFASSRSLVIKYLDFFNSVVDMKLKSDFFSVGQGGIFSSEICAIAAMDDLNSEEKASVERLVLLSLGNLKDLCDDERILASSIHGKALLSYVNNPAVTDNELKRLFRKIVLHGSNKESRKLLVDNNDLIYVRQLVSEVLSSLNRSEFAPLGKAEIVFCAVNSAIDEAERLLLSEGLELDFYRSFLRKNFPGVNYKTASLSVAPLSLAKCDAVLREVQSLISSDHIKGMCARCLGVISGKSEISKIKDATHFVELEIALKREGQFSNEVKLKLGSLSSYVCRIVSDACEKDLDNDDERRKLMLLLWNNDEVVTLSSGLMELLNIISKDVQCTFEMFRQSIDELSCGQLAADALHSRCHLSVMNDSELDCLFRAALSKRDELSLQPDAGFKVLAVTALLQAVSQRKLYQSHLHSVLSNGDVDFQSLATVLIVGLECGVLGMNNFKFFNSSCARNLYDAGGERFVSIITMHPNISEYMVNQLLMDKMTQACDADAELKLRGRVSKHL